MPSALASSCGVHRVGRVVAVRPDQRHHPTPKTARAPMPMPMSPGGRDHTTTGTKATVGGLIVRVGRVVAAAGHRTTSSWRLTRPGPSRRSTFAGWSWSRARRYRAIRIAAGRYGGHSLPAFANAAPYAITPRATTWHLQGRCLELDIGDAGGLLRKTIGCPQAVSHVAPVRQSGTRPSGPSSDVEGKLNINRGPCETHLGGGCRRRKQGTRGCL